MDSIQYELIDKQFGCMAKYLSWDVIFQNHIVQQPVMNLQKQRIL